MNIFPTLVTVEPLLRAIEGLPEIGVREDVENGYGYVMYQVAFEETFADPAMAETPEEALNLCLRREARGIKYDLETLRIISRPYHKFFNVGEKPETQPNVIDWTQPHVVLEKLDGSMLTPLYKASTNEILWMTKRGVTGVANTALDFLKSHPHYDAFCRMITEAGWTPIFEWCSRRQRIIIDYGVEDRLVLTALRRNDTGEYMRYAEMVDMANEWQLDVVKALPFTVTDVAEFIEAARKLEGEEGYIIRFEDGTMYKIKGEWYCNIHRTFDNLRFEKDVIRLVLSDSLDDAKPFMVESLRKAVDAFGSDIMKVLRAKASEIYWFTVAAKDNLNESKKRFVAHVISSELEPYKGQCFKAWDYSLDEDGILTELINTMVSATGSQGRVDAHRFLIGNLKWDDYLRVDHAAE